MISKWGPVNSVCIDLSILLIESIESVTNIAKLQIMNASMNVGIRCLESGETLNWDNEGIACCARRHALS